MKACTWLWPLSSTGERSPVFARVIWCGESSALVHVTYCPAPIASLPGPKANPAMFTSLAPVRAGRAVELPVLLGVVPVEGRVEDVLFPVRRKRDLLGAGVEPGHAHREHDRGDGGDGDPFRHACLLAGRLPGPARGLETREGA